MDSVAVSAVVITHNRKDPVLRCLESLKTSAYRPLEVLVVDNASSDGTVQAIRTEFPDVRVICNERNVLLAEARNIGIREARGEFVFLVDDDNVIDTQTIGELASLLASSRCIGMVGPVAHYLTAPELVWSGGSWVDMATSLCRHVKERHIVHGASPTWEVLCFPNAFMLQRSAVIKVGLFDSKRYPAAFCEADLGARLRAAGYKALGTRKAKVYHDIPPPGTGPGGLMRRLHFRGAGDAGHVKSYLHGRNRLLFMKQHAGWRFWPFLLFLLWPLVSGYCGLSLLSGDLRPASQYLRGVRDGIVAVFRNGKPVARL